MAISNGLIIWSLLLLGVSSVTAQRNTCAAGTQSLGARCIRVNGKDFASTYCSSVLSITTPTSTTTTTFINTSTVNITTTTSTVTETGTPPVTTTSTDTSTLDSTVSLTSTTKVFTGQSTSFVDTTTVDLTSIVYTCGNPSSTSETAQSSSTLPSGSSEPGLSSSSSNSISLTGTGPRPSASVTSITPRPPSSSSISGTGPRPSNSSSGSVSGTGPRPSGSISGSISGTGFNPSGSVSGTGPISGTGPNLSSSISGTGSQPSISVSIPGYPSSNLSVTACSLQPPITTAPPEYTYTARNEKRQTVILGNPRCLRRYSRSYGQEGISDACECLDIQTPTTVVSTMTMPNPSVTETTTIVISVEGTTTVIPTTTETRSTTIIVPVSETTTVTVSTISIISATRTVTNTIVSTLTVASQTPTSFNVYYADPSSNDTNPAAIFFKAVTAPGGSGIVLTSETGADSFMLDGQNRLVDMTAGGGFIAKNTEDLYPFGLLQTTAQGPNTPTCTACNNTLQCDYPGTSGNTFALCYNYLALGPATIFDTDSDDDGTIDCDPIDLLFK